MANTAITPPPSESANIVYGNTTVKDTLDNITQDINDLSVFEDVSNNAWLNNGFDGTGSYINLYANSLTRMAICKIRLVLTRDISPSLGWTAFGGINNTYIPKILVISTTIAITSSDTNPILVTISKNDINNAAGFHAIDKTVPSGHIVEATLMWHY